MPMYQIIIILSYVMYHLCNNDMVLETLHSLKHKISNRLEMPHSWNSENWKWVILKIVVGLFVSII